MCCKFNWLNFLEVPAWVLGWHLTRFPAGPNIAGLDLYVSLAACPTLCIPLTPGVGRRHCPFLQCRGPGDSPQEERWKLLRPPGDLEKKIVFPNNRLVTWGAGKWLGGTPRNVGICS